MVAGAECCQGFRQPEAEGGGRKGGMGHVLVVHDHAHFQRVERVVERVLAPVTVKSHGAGETAFQTPHPERVSWERAQWRIPARRPAAAVVGD